MPFALRRTSECASPLALTTEHELIAAPRKGVIAWSAFDSSAFSPADLDAAADAWRSRARQEFHSLALFSQLATQLHLIGAPLDWSGAFARMIEDEVRHTDLCLRMCEALGRPAAPDIAENDLHLASTRTVRGQVRDVVIAAFCIGETISGRMFKRAHRAATVPLAREAVAAILVDETFHAELGWELGALLMRGIEPAERSDVVERLPQLFRHYAQLCGASDGRRAAAAGPEAPPAPNFGTLTRAGYARAFFAGMDEDVVPGLVALGFPEAETAWRALDA
jgi:hypothetical protein